MKNNSDIIRSAYIGSLLKKEIEKKDLTITEVAKKMSITQPALSRVLNWKVWWSDNFFTKIWKTIGLTDKKMIEIFKNWAEEEYKYNFWEEINKPKTADDISVLDDIDFESDFINEMTLSREFRNNDAAIAEAKKIWKFLKNKYWKE